MNNIEKTVQFLGLKMNEPFKIEGRAEKLYRITNTGLQKYWSHDGENEWVFEHQKIFLDLIFGVKKIKKISRKPRDGELCFIPYIHNNKNSYLELLWRDEPQYEWFYDNGMVFRTKEEAMAKAEATPRFIK